jgi:hypothetical protein
MNQMNNMLGWYSTFLVIKNYLIDFILITDGFSFIYIFRLINIGLRLI